MDSTTHVDDDALPHCNSSGQQVPMCCRVSVSRSCCCYSCRASSSLRLTYPLLAPSLVLSALSAPSVTPVQSVARPGPGRSGLGPSGMGPLLTEMQNAPNFFSSASECSEESSLISPPSLGVPFRMRIAQRLVVLTWAHKKSCSEAALNVLCLVRLSKVSSYLKLSIFNNIVHLIRKIR